MNLHGCRQVIWDWNGTLLDDAWLCVEITNGLLSRRRLPILTRERYQRVFDFPVRDYYRRLGFDLESESFERLGTEFIEEYAARRFECTLQPHARETLEAVRRSGVAQSILSAYQQDSLRELVKYFDLGHYFTRLAGLDDHYARGKLDLGAELLKSLRCRPEEVLLVGDTAHDFEVADALGARCALVTGGHHSHEKLAACGVPVFSCLQEFRSWFCGCVC